MADRPPVLPRLGLRRAADLARFVADARASPRRRRSPRPWSALSIGSPPGRRALYVRAGDGRFERQRV
jgi:hypothetical protein